MTPEKQKEIAASFSSKKEDFDLNLKLSEVEFDLFDKGILAKPHVRKLYAIGCLL
jgi:hypothetical protein